MYRKCVIIAHLSWLTEVFKESKSLINTGKLSQRLVEKAASYILTMDKTSESSYYSSYGI